MRNQLPTKETFAVAKRGRRCAVKKGEVKRGQEKPRELKSFQLTSQSGGAPRVTRPTCGDSQGTFFLPPRSPGGGILASNRPKPHFTEVFSFSNRPKRPFSSDEKQGFHAVSTGSGTI